MRDAPNQKSIWSSCGGKKTKRETLIKMAILRTVYIERVREIDIYI